MTQQPPLPPQVPPPGPQWQPQQQPPQPAPYYQAGYPQQPQQAPYPPQYPLQYPPGWGPRPGPPPRRSGNGRTVGLVVALVVLLGGGAAVAVALSRHGGSGGQAAPAAHYDPAKATFDPKGRLRGLQHAWGRADTTQNWAGVVADTIVSGSDTGLTAVDIRSGRTRWEWKSPAKMCTMTPSATGVYAVFRTTADGDCVTVAKFGVDGKVAWQNTLPENVSLDPRLVVGGRPGAEALVAADGGGVDWIDPATGKIAYTLGPGTAPNGDFCTFVQALAGDQGVAMLTRCGWDIQNAPYHLHLYSATVPPVRKFGGLEVPVRTDLISADGHVVVATAGAPGDGVASIRAFNQAGQVTATVNPADIDLCVTEATIYSDILPSCVVVTGDTLVLRSGHRGLVAYDLGTGARRWARPGGNADSFASVGALAGGTLVLPDTLDGRHTGRMLLLDARTGRQTGDRRVAGMPARGGDTTVATGGWVVLLGQGVTVFAPA